MSATRNRKPIYTIAITASAVLLGAGGAFALSALNVDVPLFPSVGEANAQSCDPDGVTTTFTYGNSSANGMKVASAIVKGISTNCTTGSVEFLLNGSVASTYSGSVAAGSMTVATNIFTNQFDSVRVVLNP